MEKILAKKVNMTQIFVESGEVHPVTKLLLEDKNTSLTDGDTVTIRSTSKGKGFQGVVKRHKFKGGRRSHGQKHSEREPGSIGGGGRAGGRVVKGMRMAGRMGGDNVTLKLVKVVKVEPETGEVYLRGAVPGRRGTKVLITK